MIEQNDFTFKASKYGKGVYTAESDGFQIVIAAVDFSDEKIRFAEKVLAAYPIKLRDLAQFCMESECFESCYPDETVETIMEKLHLPTFYVDNSGGRFTYCNHELDEDHLIDIEFVGIMDSFESVGIDG